MNRALFFQKLQAGFRSRFVYLYFVAFPLILMSILGLVLRNNFNISEAASKVTIAYQQKDAQLSAIFTVLASKDPKSVQVESLSTAAGLKKVKAGKITAFVEREGNVWQVKLNTTSTFKTSVVKTYLQQVTHEIQYRSLEKKAGNATTQSGETTVERNRTGVRKTPTSFQYFSLSMTALFMLYMVNMGSAVFGSDRHRQLTQRILLSPLHKQQVLFSGYSAYFVLNALLILLLMVITKVLFSAEWQVNQLYAFVVLLSLMANFYTLGFFFDALQKQGSESFLNILIQIFAFLGGGYFQTSAFMKSFSPLGWALNGLQSAIWTTNALQWWPVLVNGLLALAFYLATALLIQRREVF